jgi:hypothetical protein
MFLLFVIFLAVWRLLGGRHVHFLLPLFLLPHACPLPPASQVDWSIVDAAVAKVGPRLPQHGHMLYLAILARGLPDGWLRGLMTGRLLQLFQRLQPLGNWQGFGIGMCILPDSL